MRYNRIAGLVAVLLFCLLLTFVNGYTPADAAERQEINIGQLPEKCNTDYGYQDLVDHIKNEDMIQLYNMIDQSQYAFFSSDTVAQKFADGTYYFDTVSVPQGLTFDQVFQVAALYRMDHPLYFWIPDTTVFIENENQLLLGCYEEYADPQIRRELYQKIVQTLGVFEEYLYGSTSNYTVATASLYKLAQIVDYAYDDNDVPQTASWAHSIVGVVDDAYGEVVCEGYAKFYQMLMNYFGVPNVYVVGMAGGNTGDEGSVELHAWNIVQMDDGQYYWTDPTWSDVRMVFDHVDDPLTETADHPYRVQYGDHLQGDSFMDTHWPLTTDNTGSMYMYPLPETASEAYEPEGIGLPANTRMSYGIIGDCFDGKWINTDDYCFFVVQNDGLHRCVEFGGYFGSDKNVIIPAEIEYDGFTYQVVGTDLDIAWDVETVTISEGIRYIHGDLNYENQITRVLNIPSTVEFYSAMVLSTVCLEEINVAEDNPYVMSIDGVLFSKDGTMLLRYPVCAKRTSYTVPSSVTSLYDSAFGWNRYLKELNLPEGLLNIGNNAFRQMLSLEALDIPSTVAQLEDRILYGCESIKYVHIGRDTAFNWTSFQDALALETIDIEEGNPCGYVYDGALYSGTTLCCYPAGRKADTVRVKEDCSRIYYYAFSYGQEIGTVIIPDGCNVEPSAFYASKVASLTISNQNTSIRYADGAIYSPDMTILHTYLGGCKSKSFTVPESVTLIDAGAFLGNEYIEEITMSDSVTDVRGGAFKDCTALKKIRLSDSIKWTVDADYEKWITYANIFENCSSLEEITLPKASPHIPFGMFYLCRSLKKVILPENIETIGNGVFADTHLEEIYVYNKDIRPYGGTTWDSWAGKEFIYSHGINGVSEDSGKVRTVVYGHPDASFLEYINNVENYQLIFRDITKDADDKPTSGKCGDDVRWSISGSTLTISGTGAMYNYANSGAEAPWLWHWADTIEKVVIQSGVTSIGGGAFYGCDKLTQVKMPKGLKTIGEFAFANCFSLTEIELPQELRKIERSAFNSCSQLKSVHLPDGVKLSYAAFNGCNSLTEVVIPEGAEDAYGVFRNCQNLTTVFISKSVQYFNFEGCPAIAHVYLAHDVNEEQLLHIMEYGALKDCAVKPTIYGCAGTIVEEYCLRYGYTFVDVHGTDYCERPKEHVHSYTETVIMPTCVDQGYTIYTCFECGDGYVSDYTEATGHSYSDWYMEKDATCSENGSERRDCAACGQSETQQTATRDHKYRSEVTVSTCTEQGYTTYTCVECGDGYVSDYTEATGHSYGDWYTEKDAICSENGSERRDCAACGQFETQQTAAKGHTYSSKVTAPTCTEQGYTTYTCVECGDGYVGAHVAASGHTEVIDKAVAATCTSSGLSEGKHCSVCHANLVTQSVIPAMGHADENKDFSCDVCEENLCEDHTEVRIPGTPETCEQFGLTDGKKCANCGEVLSAQEVIPASGHHYGDWVEVKTPTTEEKGLEERTCANCGNKEQQVLAKLEPAPTEPTAPETQPTEPIPTDPAPTDPSGTDPVQTKPVQTDPQQTVPAIVPTTAQQPKPEENNLPLIAVIVTVVLGGGAAAALVLLKKK